MIDKIIFILATLLIATVILLTFLDFQYILNVLLKIMAISGFIIAVFDFIKKKNKR